MIILRCFDQVHFLFSGRKFNVGWSLLELLGPSATTTEFYRLSGQQQLAKRDFWVRACTESARAHAAQLPNCSAQLPNWSAHCPAVWCTSSRQPARPQQLKSLGISPSCSVRNPLRFHVKITKCYRWLLLLLFIIFKTTRAKQL